jgi:hypothetical protein
VISAEDEARAVDHVAERLTIRFPGIPMDTVLAAGNASYEMFTGKPIRDFVPVMVERAARERLRTVARPT